MQVSDSSTPETVKFKSNFMGTFCTGVFVLPNTIDYDKVLSNFDELLADNWVVLAVMVTLVSIYIPLVILARRRDKRDKLMVGSRESPFNLDSI